MIFSFVACRKLTLGPYLISDWRILTKIPIRGSKWKRSWLGGDKKIKTNMVFFAISNRKNFLCLFSQLMVFLERMPWLHYRMWVDAWQQKWRKPFCTCEDGLKVISQWWSRNFTPVRTAYHVFPVPYGTRSWTENWVRVMDWHNKLRATITKRTRLPTSPLTKSPTTYI